MADAANTTRRSFLKSVPACGMAAIVPVAALAARVTPEDRLEAAIAELKAAAEAIWPDANDWMVKLGASPSMPVFINVYDPDWDSKP